MENELIDGSYWTNWAFHDGEMLTIGPDKIAKWDSANEEWIGHRGHPKIIGPRIPSPDELRAQAEELARVKTAKQNWIRLAGGNAYKAVQYIEALLQAFKLLGLEENFAPIQLKIPAILAALTAQATRLATAEAEVVQLRGAVELMRPLLEAGPSVGGDCFIGGAFDKAICLSCGFTDDRVMIREHAPDCAYRAHFRAIEGLQAALAAPAPASGEVPKGLTRAEACAAEPDVDYNFFAAPSGTPEGEPRRERYPNMTDKQFEATRDYWREQNPPTTPAEGGRDGEK